MIPRRLVEATIRSLWIIPIPVFLVPTLILLMVEPEEHYESSATVWVTPQEDTTLGALVRVVDPEATPAENQALILGDLLATRSFREAVAAAVWGDEAAAVDGAESALSIAVGERIALSTDGTHLLAIHASADDAATAQRLVEAVIEQFEIEAAAAAARDAESLIELIQLERGQALNEFNARQDELFAYIEANPEVLVVADPLEPITTDPTYARLLSRYETQSAIVDELWGQYQDALLAEEAARAGQQAAFRIQDAATLPASPTAPALLDRLMLPAAGVVLGFGIAGAYVLAIAYLRRRVDSTEDLEAIGVPVVGQVPEIQGRLVPVKRPLLPRPWAGRTKHYARVVATSISLPKGQEG